MSIEKIIAKIFVFFLPFQLFTFLQPIFGPFGAQASAMSFPFHLIGLVLILVSDRGRIRIRWDAQTRLILLLGQIIGITYAASLLMAGYIYIQYGDFNGTSPFIAATKLALDFVQYLLIILYTKRVFRILGTDGVWNCLHSTLRVLLVIGYLQLGTILENKLCTAIYTPMAEVMNMVQVTEEYGVSLGLMEPSHAAMLVGAVVIPFYMSKIFFSNDRKKLYPLELLLWVPLILYSQSTTMYLMVFTAVGIAILLAMFKRGVRKSIRFSVMILLAAGIFIMFHPEWIDSATGLNFTYLLTEKVSDAENQSTASRMIPLVGDLLIFLRYPLLGCGNGLQGYFFKDVIPSSMKRGALDKASRKMLQGAGPLANGQLFTPGILSGYGLVGTFLFAVFFYKSWQYIRKHRQDFGLFYWIYMIGLLPIIVCSFKSDFIGNYYIWFVLSIPLAIRKTQNETQVSGGNSDRLHLYPNTAAGTAG